MKKITLLILLLLVFNLGQSQTKLAEFTFENPGGYSTSITEFVTNPSGTDYFIRTDGSDINNVAFSNVQGSYYFAAQDIIDGASPAETLLIENINISGYSNIEFRVHLAEDDDGTNENWDAADYVHFNYDIDNSGTFSSLLWIESTGTNTEPQIDTDFDGVGDGASITDTFTQFTQSIVGSGSLIDIEIEMWLNTGGDDIAIDNIEIWGTLIPCSTTTTWNGITWDNVTGPDTTIEAIIDGNYDTAIEGSFSACNLTVTNGNTLNIANNDHVEVQNDLNVDTGGTITVQPYGAFIQNDDSGSVTNSGLIQVAKDTAPLDNWYEYTYWSSPVSGARVEDVLSDSDENRRFIFIAQNFLDATAETANNNATVAGQDDIDDNNNDWLWVNGATVMQQGVGYAATHSEASFIFPGANYRYIFEGPFNNGIINTPVYRNDGSTLDKNWNLIGNPYPSAIEIDAFLAQNMYPAGPLEGTIYFWSQNTDYSTTANGNQALNFDTTDYATYNGMGGTVGGDGLTPNGFIPSGQAFFVSYSDSPASSTGTVVFNNAMRSLSLSPDNSQFFKSLNSKKNSTSNDNKLWIDLTSDNGVFNQILVGYTENATDGDDGTYYDASKIVAPKAFSALYSTIEGSDKKFAIQGKATNSLNKNEVIELGFSTNIDVPTLYKLSIAQLQGTFLANNVIYLKDNLLNKLHDLSTSDYTFTSEVGVFNSRFEIVFSALALSTDEHILDTNALKIVELENDHVQFNVSDNLNIKTVNIYDLLGRQLYNLGGNSSSETYNLSNLNNTIYIAKVELSSGVVITKKALKN